MSRLAGAGRGVEWRSVRDAESLRHVLRTLELVEDRDGVVLEGDEALALVVGEELVVSRTVFSGPLPWRDLGGRTQVSPLQSFRVLAPDVERFPSLARLVGVDRREVGHVGE